MANHIRRRVIHMPNIPIKLCMPTYFTNITEIALKTIPSASKIEIRRLLESVYGFEVAKVETLNRAGKKTKRGGLVIYKPDYKKAYVTLRRPLSINHDLYPIREILEEQRNMQKQSQSSIVEDPEAVKKTHWLEETKPLPSKSYTQRPERLRMNAEQSAKRHREKKDSSSSNGAAFPWSSMRRFGSDHDSSSSSEDEDARSY